MTESELCIPEPTASILDRVRYLINFSRHNQASFARLNGIDPAYLSRILNGRLEPSEGFINRLVVNMGVSKEWLTTGRNVPFPRNTEMSVEVIPAIMPTGAPVYDIDVTAGIVPLSRMFTEDRIIGYVNLPGVSSDFPVVRVTGESMAPRIPSGSFISIRSVRVDGTISWGQIYVVVLEDYRFVKILRRHSDRDMVILHSLNPDFDDIEIARNQIQALYLVEAIINYDQVG